MISQLTQDVQQPLEAVVISESIRTMINELLKSPLPNRSGSKQEMSTPSTVVTVDVWSMRSDSTDFLISLVFFVIATRLRCTCRMRVGVAF
jgi:hypothetical protein